MRVRLSSCLIGLLLLLGTGLQAAPLTTAQLLVLKTDIMADGALSGLAHTPDNADLIAQLYNQVASPAFWVWRTSVPVQEILETTTGDGTSWSWVIYIGRSQAERDGWRDMTRAGSLNVALLSTRQGLADIFSGAGGLAQRTHLLTVGRRQATRAEKLLAIGAGLPATPATMGFEGALRYTDIQNAWGS